MKFKTFNNIDLKEFQAAKKVIKSGILSGFVASNSKEFNGGKYVQKFERKLEKFYGVKYAITLNSWTSGLIAAIGALNIEPGDEIIVSPWTMSATATAIIHWNAIPVFVDIDKYDYCIDVNKVKKLITAKTKAIIVVDIFGKPADINSLKKIVKKKKISIISDSAQTPYSFLKNKLAGTNADIGGYSLNCHKHIQTGEGGIIVTNNDKFAKRIRLIRNHGEAVIENMKIKDINNIIGYNFRMGELEAAIGIEQLKKLKKIIKKKISEANYIIKGLSKIEGLNLPQVSRNFSHSFYSLPIRLNLEKINFTRSALVKELKRNGLEGFVEGYTNLHRLPIYQKKIAYGKKGFPWNFIKRKINYKKGICPVAEELHDRSFLNFAICKYHLNQKNLKFIVNTFKTAWKKLSEK